MAGDDVTRDNGSQWPWGAAQFRRQRILFVSRPSDGSKVGRSDQVSKQLLRPPAEMARVLSRAAVIAIKSLNKHITNLACAVSMVTASGVFVLRSTENTRPRHFT